MLIIHNAEVPINETNTIEYLRQLGKRIQIYWGTSYPKSFVRTFSEITQLLRDTHGLSIRIIEEDNLQKVRLEIEPYTNSFFNNDKKSNFKTNTYKIDDEKLSIKTHFLIEKEILNMIISHFSRKNDSQNKFDFSQAMGLNFCIGKETLDSENYNYSIIIQAVNICNNRIVDEKMLPIIVPSITNLIP